MSNLTDKQRLFVSAYCGAARFNGSEAARLAGYGNKKTNPETYAAIAYENLRKPHIQEAVSAMLSDRLMSDEEAALIIAEQARNHQMHYLRPDGTIDLHELIADGLAYLVKGTKMTKEGLVVEFYDAQAAAHKIRQAHGAYGPTGRADDPLHAEIRFVVEDRRSGVEERKRQHERLLTNGTAG